MRVFVSHPQFYVDNSWLDLLHAVCLVANVCNSTQNRIDNGHFVGHLIVGCVTGALFAKVWLTSRHNPKYIHIEYKFCIPFSTAPSSLPKDCNTKSDVNCVSTRSVSTTPECTAVACRQATISILARSNWKIDPCKDFTSFSCGSTKGNVKTIKSVQEGVDTIMQRKYDDGSGSGTHTHSQSGKEKQFMTK